MHILRIAQNVYPDVSGGAPYHVHAMSRDQAAMGHDVTVLTTLEDSELPEIEKRDGYTVVRVSPGVTLLGNDVSPAVARYLWGVESEAFDVIHAHSHLYFATNLAALKRRLGDIPLAITNHGLYSQNAPEWVFRQYLRTLGRWTYNRADVAFCYTEVDKERLREFGVTTRVEVVPNGIDTERFTPDGPESELIDHDGPVVLFVGRLVEGKRPGIAIEAFAEVLEEYPDAGMYLCGDGSLREGLETQVEELGIKEAVTFLGDVPYDEMPKVYRSGDVLVLPSRAEGVPRTVLEAMSSDVAIVVSDLEQITAVVGDTGRHVTFDDQEQIVSEVKNVLDTDGAVSNERDRIVERCRWQDTVAKTTRVLESTTTGSSGSDG